MHRTLAAAFAAVLAAGSGPAAAQAFPSKPVRLIVPFPAGGGVDIVARTLSQKLGKRLGQPVMVENIAGGATVPGVMSALKDKAEGYTLLLASDGSLNINQYVIKGLRYNPDTDLTPVTILNTVPHWIVARSDRRYSMYICIRNDTSFAGRFQFSRLKE